MRRENSDLKSCKAQLEVRNEDLQEQLAKVRKHEGHLATELDKCKRQLADVQSLHASAEEKRKELEFALQDALAEATLMEAQSLKSAHKCEALERRFGPHMQKQADEAQKRQKNADKQLRKQKNEADRLKSLLAEEKAKAAVEKVDFTRRLMDSKKGSCRNCQ